MNSSAIMEDNFIAQMIAYNSRLDHHHGHRRDQCGDSPHDGYEHEKGGSCSSQLGISDETTGAVHIVDGRYGEFHDFYLSIHLLFPSIHQPTRPSGFIYVFSFHFHPSSHRINNLSAITTAQDSQCSAMIHGVPSSPRPSPLSTCSTLSIPEI